MVFHPHMQPTVCHIVLGDAKCFYRALSLSLSLSLSVAILWRTTWPPFHQRSQLANFMMTNRFSQQLEAPYPSVDTALFLLLKTDILVRMKWKWIKVTQWKKWTFFVFYKEHLNDHYLLEKFISMFFAVFIEFILMLLLCLRTKWIFVWKIFCPISRRVLFKWGRRHITCGIPHGSMKSLELCRAGH